jgi:F-type H+-transporting ATPase subunit b
LIRNQDLPVLTMVMSPVSATRRRLVRALVATAAVVWVLAAVSGATLAAGQPPAAAEAPTAHGTQPPAGDAGLAAQAEPHGQEAAAGHGEAESEGGHAESPWAVIARLFNFVLLAGALVYLLRSPLMGYLTQRGIQVRSELTAAAALRKTAGAQIAQVDAKMAALPGEIEALKRRGAEEIAAEEARIGGLAESERRRLLEQATREIESQLRVAERELKKRAGELAVDVATSRVKRTITDRDHARLVDQYVSQVRQ